MGGNVVAVWAIPVLLYFSLPVKRKVVAHVYKEVASLVTEEVNTVHVEYKFAYSSESVWNLVH
jgi:hypothetical protein